MRRLSRLTRVPEGERGATVRYQGEQRPGAAKASLAGIPDKVWPRFRGPRRQPHPAGNAQDAGSWLPLTIISERGVIQISGQLIDCLRYCAGTNHSDMSAKRK
jgi:hypothetical protein